MKKIYQGEPFDIIFECLEDDGRTPYDLTNTEVSAVVVDSCGSPKFKYSTKNSEVVRLIEKMTGGYLKLSFSEEDTRSMQGDYTLQVKASFEGEPAIDILSRPITIHQATIGRIEGL